MLKFIQQLIDLNSELLARARSATKYDEALALYEVKEYSKAFPLMKEAAELGGLPAMSILGSMYLLGRGVRENGTEAERWLIEPKPGTAAARARDFGVDLSLTVSNLRMTPAERVKRLDDFQHEMRLLRQAVLLAKQNGRTRAGTKTVR